MTLALRICCWLHPYNKTCMPYNQVAEWREQTLHVAVRFRALNPIGSAHASIYIYTANQQCQSARQWVTIACQ